MKLKKIVLTDYGIASSYDSFIEINRKLKGKLRDKIIAHELRHEKGKYSSSDWKNDFHSKNPHFFEALWFAIRNPEALINYFAVMYSYYGDYWTFNLSSIFPFAYFGLIWVLFFALLFRIGIFRAFLGYVCIYVMINIILLVYTHLYAQKCEKQRKKSGNMAKIGF